MMALNRVSKARQAKAKLTGAEGEAKVADFGHDVHSKGTAIIVKCDKGKSAGKSAGSLDGITGNPCDYWKGQLSQCDHVSMDFLTS